MPKVDFREEVVNVALEKWLRSERPNVGRIIGSIASAAAAVAIGAHSGLPPLLSVPLVGAASFVGTRLLGKAAESASGITSR
jgi:hypothetical protein